MTRNVARIAINIAKLPELLQQVAKSNAKKEAPTPFRKNVEGEVFAPAGRMGDDDPTPALRCHGARASHCISIFLRSDGQHKNAASKTAKPSA